MPYELDEFKKMLKSNPNIDKDSVKAKVVNVINVYKNRNRTIPDGVIRKVYSGYFDFFYSSDEYSTYISSDFLKSYCIAA